MAPIRKVNKKSKPSPIRKVQTGRVGQLSSKISIPHTRNVGKELFAQLLVLPVTQVPSQSVTPTHSLTWKLDNALLLHQCKRLNVPQRKQKPQSKHPPLDAADKKLEYLREFNAKLRFLKVTKDGTAKRLLALHDEITYKPPQDVRDTETVPYSQASLSGARLSTGPITLNIEVACGFWVTRLSVLLQRYIVLAWTDSPTYKSSAISSSAHKIRYDL